MNSKISDFGITRPNPVIRVLMILVPKFAIGIDVYVSGHYGEI